MKKAIKEKKLMKDAYTVESPKGRRYKIRPIVDEFTASDLSALYHTTTQEAPRTMEDGSRMYYDWEWFFIRETEEYKKVIAILIAT